MWSLSMSWARVGLLPKHPVSEVGCAFYHGVLAGLTFLGFAFHVYATVAHWWDREKW